MYGLIISRGAPLALRSVRPFFSRFAAPGSRLVQSQGGVWSKFLANIRKSPKLKWFFGIVRDAAVFSAAAAGIDWAIDWWAGDDVKDKDGNQVASSQSVIQGILLNDVVALALDASGSSDVESTAIILDNYAMTCLNAGDSNLTMEGLATAAAAEYLRRTRNGSFVYDLPDALNIIHTFEQKLQGIEEPEDLSDSDLTTFQESIDELEKESGSTEVSRLADLMAFQVTFIENMQTT